MYPCDFIKLLNLFDNHIYSNFRDTCCWRRRQQRHWPLGIRGVGEGSLQRHQSKDQSNHATHSHKTSFPPASRFHSLACFACFSIFLFPFHLSLHLLYPFPLSLSLPLPPTLFTFHLMQHLILSISPSGGIRTWDSRFYCFFHSSFLSVWITRSFSFHKSCQLVSSFILQCCYWYPSRPNPQNGSPRDNQTHQ